MGTSAVFLYRNYADAATLSGGSWSMPLINAQDPDLGVVARSTDPLNASTKFTADLGSLISIGGLVLGPVNSSPASTYRFRGYSDAALTTLVHDSGVKTVPGSTINWSNILNWLAWENPDFWLGVPDAGASLGSPLYLFDIPDADQFARYWLIELFDAANGAGYVQFGRLMIAKAYRPSMNYDVPDNPLSFDFVGDSQETLGAVVNYWDRAVRRTWRASFPRIDETEIFGSVFDMAMLSRLSHQVFVAPDPSDTANARKRNFLATFKQAPALAQMNTDRGSTAFDFLEVAWS